MRALAKIVSIDGVENHPNADQLDVAVVGGWQVVVKREEFRAGDRAVFFEIDSWVPSAIAPFLSRDKEPREYEGVKGERLKTMKLRGELSQGLLISLAAFAELEAEYGQKNDEVDVTEKLGVLKWEAPIELEVEVSTTTHSKVKPPGNFPKEVPKTSQERIQNLRSNLKQWLTETEIGGLTWEITEKVDGCSCTMLLTQADEFIVCSRNNSLGRDDQNTYWSIAMKHNIENKMREAKMQGIAIQGEIVGPKIQANRYKFRDFKFFVFDVYNTNTRKFQTPTERRVVVEKLGLDHVPLIDAQCVLQKDETTISLLKLADGKSVLAPAVAREGLVFRRNTHVIGFNSFKVISNAWLLKGGN
eukprot:c26042_g1_i1.p1 GENE.c26042_g1_i1~~c26042_g1_i1.p1  ORF type:complete len:390 (+),score=79.10 c26042_g1_i1:96-1172(+)